MYAQYSIPKFTVNIVLLTVSSTYVVEELPGFWLSEHSSLCLHNSDIVSYSEPVKSTVEPSIPLTSYIPNIHFNITVSSTCKSLKWTLPNKCLRQTRCSPSTVETFECVLHNSLITFFSHSDIWWKRPVMNPALSFPSAHSLSLPPVRPRYFVQQLITKYLHLMQRETKFKSCMKYEMKLQLYSPVVI